MKYSVNGGTTWLGPVIVANALDDQFIPSITADSSTGTVNIAYFDNHVDDHQFQHRLVVDLNQIPKGSTTPTAPTKITSKPNDPASDPLLFAITFLGDSIGLAARGTGAVGASRIYSAYASNLRQGTYNGALAPQQDNFLNRLTY